MQTVLQSLKHLTVIYKKNVCIIKNYVKIKHITYDLQLMLKPLCVFDVFIV